MTRQVFINLPVSDLGRAQAFYEELGFVNNPEFSNDKGVAMVWSDGIILMLLTRDFYKTFIRDKSVIDTQTQSGTLVALSMESREAVQVFADTAKANGGDYFSLDSGVPEDQIFGYEVLDPDGNQWEPFWMNVG